MRDLPEVPAKHTKIGIYGLLGGGKFGNEKYRDKVTDARERIEQNRVQMPDARERIEQNRARRNPIDQGRNVFVKGNVLLLSCFSK